MPGDPYHAKGYKGRVMVIGPTKAGRMLAVVLESEGEEAYYPVTARPASRKEHRLYQRRPGEKL